MFKISSIGNDMSVDTPETLRRYYLNAMGIQCWVESNPAAESIAGPAMKQQPSAPAPQPQTTGAVASLAEQVAQCTQCALNATSSLRKLGQGKSTAELMLIFIAPDAVENNADSFLTAESASLLEKMLRAIELDYDDVYISSLLKCPLPVGHKITSAEIEACRPFLNQQINWLQPRMILLMGIDAAQGLLQTTSAPDDLRLLQHDYAGAPVVVSYALKDLLATPSLKRKAWADLQYLQKIYRRVENVSQ